ncbi:MAG: class I SAM-dependent methyltransferase [Anaerolineae bacterium]|nr:class I SAM-dependent methyltransferase [Anaerolineae bacterium]
MTTTTPIASPSQRICQDEDVERLLRLVCPEPVALALDVAIGQAHSLPALAKYADRAMALDVSTVTESLPWDAETFDLVCCLFAAHRIPDIVGFFDEAARVLKPGGSLLVYDRLLPEADRAAHYVDAFYRLGDPAHRQTFADYVWQGMCLNAGLDVAHVETCQTRARLLPWAKANGCSDGEIERLQILLAQASRAVADFLHPTCAGTADAEFDQYHIALVGRKR